MSRLSVLAEEPGLTDGVRSLTATATTGTQREPPALAVQRVHPLRGATPRTNTPLDAPSSVPSSDQEDLNLALTSALIQSQTEMQEVLLQLAEERTRASETAAALRRARSDATAQMDVESDRLPPTSRALLACIDTVRKLRQV